MTQRIVLVCHQIPEMDDRASNHLAGLGYRLDWKVPCKGDSLGPVTPDTAGTIVYGGKYCITDIPEMPFLQDEIRWLKACIAAKLPVLGICQGAQMIAHILGAEVGPHPDGWHEFGYYPVTPTAEGRDFLPETLHMTQAHFHQFQIPDGAVHLAGSALFGNQAFRWGEHVYGLQFHPEVTPEGFRRWQDADWQAGVYAKPGVQPRAEQDRSCASHDGAMDRWFRGFLDDLFGPAG
ncbi:MAG: glutamine amidotransferase [Rhodobacteraceae bacterium]|nr:glutamine amidotransferase [Paracoccaceae bacterium]